MKRAGWGLAAGLAACGALWISAAAQEPPKNKPKDAGGKPDDCKHECQEKMKALRDNFHDTVERMRREMEAQVAAIRATCKHGEGGGGEGAHPGKPKPDGKCDCCCARHCTHSTKGNNGVGNGVDPQPPGNPPVNDGPGAAPGNPGNKKHGPADGKGGKPEDPGKGGKPDDRGGAPPGKGNPGKTDDDDKGKGKPKS